MTVAMFPYKSWIQLTIFGIYKILLIAAPKICCETWQRPGVALAATSFGGSAFTGFGPHQPTAKPMNIRFLSGTQPAQLFLNTYFLWMHRIRGHSLSAPNLRQPSSPSALNLITHKVLYSWKGYSSKPPASNMILCALSTFCLSGKCSTTKTSFSL